MLYIICSIICSVSVGIILKYARRFEVRTTQIVAFNYLFALLLCYLFLSPDLNIDTSSAPWYLYSALAILLPSIFLFLAASIRNVGIVKTDAAQRLSLFIPVLAAWIIFREDFNILKIIGLAIGFPAILFIFSKKEKNGNEKWHYPAIVLLGFGIIDVLFKQVSLVKAIPSGTSLFIIFCCAMAVATLIAVYQVIFHKAKFNLYSFAFGALVGIFNFGNIFFYIQAHKAFANNPSTVFAIMNIGVIVLGTICGIVLFKEKITKLNFAGLLMAISAIIFITLSQVYS